MHQRSQRISLFNLSETSAWICCNYLGPHHKYLIDNIEKIQWRAARWVMSDYRLTSSVSDMILALNWSTLEQWLCNSRLTILMKTNSSINVPPHYSPLTLLKTPSNSILFMHFAEPCSPTTFYQKNFFPKTIRGCKNLPHRVIESDSLNEFTDYFHWQS